MATSTIDQLRQGKGRSNTIAGDFSSVSSTASSPDFSLSRSKTDIDDKSAIGLLEDYYVFLVEKEQQVSKAVRSAGLDLP